MKPPAKSNGMRGQSTCPFCHRSIPDFETARTLTTPPGYGELPVGSGWVICGEDCPDLPKTAEVYYRRIAFEVNTGSKRKAR